MPWNTLSVTARGSDHHRRGLPNQDAVQVRLAAGNTIVALADGAGSAPRADEGSREVCQALCEYVAVQLTQQPDPDPAVLHAILGGAMAHAHQSLRHLAARYTPPSDQAALATLPDASIPVCTAPTEPATRPSITPYMVQSPSVFRFLADRLADSFLDRTPPCLVLPPPPDPEPQALVQAATPQLEVPVSAPRRPDLPATPRDFAATALLLILTPRYVAAAQVGDGTILGFAVNPPLRGTALTKATHGQYASETYFISGHRYHEYLSQVVLPVGDYQAFALMSDGVEPFAMDLARGEAYSPFFEDTLASARGTGAPSTNARLERLFGSDAVLKTTGDDKTLALIYRPENVPTDSKEVTALSATPAPPPPIPVAGDLKGR